MQTMNPEVIDATLRTVSEYMKKTFGNRDGYDYEVIFSDDGSTDGCRAKVESFGDDHIRTVGYEKNRGKGCAIRTGVLAAEGNIVIFTDCDLAYGLDVVAEAVERFEKDPEADIIIGSRNLSNDGYEGYTLLRKIASKTYIKCLALAAGFSGSATRSAASSASDGRPRGRYSAPVRWTASRSISRRL